MYTLKFLIFHLSEVKKILTSYFTAISKELFCKRDTKCVQVENKWRDKKLTEWIFRLFPWHEKANKNKIT